MRLILKNGRVIDPATAMDKVQDLYVENQTIVGLGATPAGFVADRVIDASGKLVMPGLVDVAPQDIEPLAASAGGISCSETPQGFVALRCDPKVVAAQGAYAFRLGLSGDPAERELNAIASAIELTRQTQQPMHLGRLSSAAGVALIRSAKHEGLPITCDVSIHHVHLTDVDIGFYDSRCKLDPPLRGQRDRAALRTGLADGTIDALCSDHLILSADGKIKPFPLAEPGATGAELLLSLTLKWAEQEQIDLTFALSRVTSRPSELVLGYSAGLAVGALANLCIVDNEVMWTVKENNLMSASRYTPFAGIEVPGRVTMTLQAGQVVWELA